MTIGALVTIARGGRMIGATGRILARYRSPFGPSWLVALADGSTVAVQARHLDSI